MSDLRRQFEKQGYVVIESFLDDVETVELQEETKRFIAGVVPTIDPKEVYYENIEDKSSLKQVQQIASFDDYYKRLAASAKVVGLAEELLGAPVKLMNMQYFNKIPRVRLRRLIRTVITL